MILRTLPSTTSLQGKRVLVRVDWNVPLTGTFRPEEMLKITQSLEDIHAWQKRGAIIILLTHLGRPEGKDPLFSTKRLLPVLKHRYKLSLHHHSASISNQKERDALLEALKEAKAGSIHLLENVRFEHGEETGDKNLIKAYAALGELFINNAFASSHRKHVSVFGLAKEMTSYAGPELVKEVKALSVLLKTPKKPFFAILGGAKLSTKLPIIQALAKVCDKLYIAGAMATVFRIAQGEKMGRSYYEKDSVAEAKRLLKKWGKKIVLPTDVIAVHHLDEPGFLQRKNIDKLEKMDISVDLGTDSLKVWMKEWEAAKTILWNGPVGKIEIKEYGFGSRAIARVLGKLAKKNDVFVVVGGGDTLPAVVEAGVADDIDHVSCGGGAMLEFIALKGKLPGLLPLIK